MQISFLRGWRRLACARMPRKSRFGNDLYASRSMRRLTGRRQQEQEQLGLLCLTMGTWGTVAWSTTKILRCRRGSILRPRSSKIISISLTWIFRKNKTRSSNSLRLSRCFIFSSRICRQRPWTPLRSTETRWWKWQRHASASLNQTRRSSVPWSSNASRRYKPPELN